MTCLLVLTDRNSGVVNSLVFSEIVFVDFYLCYGSNLSALNRRSGRAKCRGDRISHSTADAISARQRPSGREERGRSAHRFLEGFSWDRERCRLPFASTPQLSGGLRLRLHDRLRRALRCDLRALLPL